MDNIAHTLAGAVLAQTGLKNRTALGTATLLIGANLPDVDVVALLWGDGLSLRRGWTHGVLALFVLPLLLTGGMLLWDLVRRRRGSVSRHGLVRPRQLLLLSFVGVFSHPLLDWLNTYGLRWLMPFDGTWFYGDALFIVDPWLWLILLLGVVGAKRAGRRAGRAALACAVVYMTLMTASSAIGRRLVADEMRAQGFTPVDVMVGPVPVNPNRRQVIVREAGRYLLGTLEWLPRPRLRISERAVDASDDHPLVVQARLAPEAQEFLGWARFPFYRIREQNGGYVVVMDDLRYSDGESTSWAAVRIEFPGPPRPNTTNLTSLETGGVLVP